MNQNFGECFCCGKELSKDEVGINKKMIDLHIEEFQCYDCLAEEFGTTVDFLLKKVEEFKEEGCTLF